MSNTHQKAKAEKANIWLAGPLQDLLDVTEVSADPDCVDGPEKSAREGQAISLSRRLNRYAERSLWALRADPPVLSRLAWDLITRAFFERTEIELFDIQTLHDRVREALLSSGREMNPRLEAALDEIAGMTPMQAVAVVMVVELLFSDEEVTNIGGGNQHLAISVVTHLPESACYRGDPPLSDQWEIVEVFLDDDLVEFGLYRVLLENRKAGDEEVVMIERHGSGYKASSIAFEEDDPVRWGRHDPREILAAKAAQAVADRKAAI